LSEDLGLRVGSRGARRDKDSWRDGEPREGGRWHCCSLPLRAEGCLPLLVPAFLGWSIIICYLYCQTLKHSCHHILLHLRLRGINRWKIRTEFYDSEHTPALWQQKEIRTSVGN
jgi:hypothetical protein